MKILKRIFITRVKEENGWLSCMSPYPVTDNGLEYRTCEAFFQSLRFKGYPEVQQEIRDAKSPMTAKMLARKHRDLLNRGEKWDEDPDDIPRMKKCLELKVAQNPELKDKLIATGNAEIIEDSTPHPRESARFWGMVHKGGEWIGENHLGRLWMELREELNEIKNTRS